MQHNPLQRNAMQYNAINARNAMQYNAINALQCNALQINTIPAPVWGLAPAVPKPRQPPRFPGGRGADGD